MLRLTRFGRSPILLFAFPFCSNDNPHDKSKNVTDVIKLDDELGWDRVKKVFKKNEYGELSKELQSVINITISGLTMGAIIGCLKTTHITVNDFIANNEATKFHNNFHARSQLHQKVVENFLSKGGRLGIKLGFFCLIFSSITTCMTAYRGKLKIGNYIVGASVTGLLFRINMGIRAALIGTGLGGILGAICGGTSLLILNLTGITMDEVLRVQTEWISSRNKTIDERIKKGLAKEIPEIQKAFEENQKLNALQERKNVEDSKI